MIFNRLLFIELIFLSLSLLNKIFFNLDNKQAKQFKISFFKSISHMLKLGLPGFNLYINVKNRNKTIATYKYTIATNKYHIATNKYSIATNKYPIATKKYNIATKTLKTQLKF